MGTQHAVGILFKLLWFCGARGVLAGLGKKKKKSVVRSSCDGKIFSPEFHGLCLAGRGIIPR